MTGIDLYHSRYWHVTVHRNGADWPDVVDDAYAVNKVMRPECLDFTVNIDAAGTLHVSRPDAIGRNVRKDGSLGAEAKRPVYEDWATPLVVEALRKIEATAWPEPRLP